ncbi:2-amino-4-hydroxy-6-hydroxymethyldihydropteridine diphosphokinase [bacterium]|nr:2-amino-4-hydroxy-6-hydroxymethyldihydropteridine diphosphokinase [bacterium]
MIKLENIVYLSLGSNLGDRLQNLKGAIERIKDHPGIIITALSKFYKTEPMPRDHFDSEWFINCALKLKTSLTPRKLLNTIHSIECDMGRAPGHQKLQSRTIDIDILLYNDEIVQEPDLSIPHPEMENRRFVMQPLCDIEPGVLHPVLKTDAIFILNNLKDNFKVICCDI